METKIYAVTFYQNVELVFLQMRMNEYQKLTKTLGNIKKNCRSYQKMLKFETLKSEKHSLVTRNYAVPY